MMYSELYKNLNDLFQKRVEESRTQIALKFKKNGNWISYNWEQYYSLSKCIGMGLKNIGANEFDKVCLLGNSSVEWLISDMGVIGIRGISVPIYHSNTPAECQYIIENSEAKYIFVEDIQQYEKIKQIKQKVPTLKKCILMNGEIKDDFVITFEELKKIGERYSIDEFKAITKEVVDTEHVTYIYTSGTTGNPKGVILNHKNLIANAQGIINAVAAQVKYGDTVLMFLPPAHIFARIVQFVAIYRGLESGYAESVEKLSENIIDLKPHFIPAVPRIFEKIYSKIVSGVEEENILKKNAFYFFLQVGREYSKAIQNKEQMSGFLKTKYLAAKKVIFSKLKAKFGGRLKLFVSAGAPLSAEIAEFFHAADISVLEIYGLTEVAGALTSNRPNNYKFGTVGLPITSVDLTIAPDGEILCKGAILMEGYYKNEAATKEAIDEAGWFHTGDIGEIDDDGFVKITDRKKDIIVTAAGKNIAPQNIENLMKSDRFISQIIVLGDKMKYLVALINVNFEEIKKYADNNKIKYNTKEDLLENKKVIDFIENILEEKNKELPSYATIKKFKILPNEFSIETGELTPTLKVKRKFCMEKYKDVIAKLY